MKFKVLNPVYDTKEAKTYAVGDVFEAEGERLDAIKAKLSEQGGLGLYLEEVETKKKTNKKTDKKEVTEE